MEVAILGTGNAGCAHAVKLYENGHNVRLIKTSSTLHGDNYNIIKKLKGINVIDNTTNGVRKFVPISMITKDIEKGINGADIVLIFTQTLQHEALAKRVSKYFIPGQIVVLIPGNMGSFYFANQSQPGVIFAEGETTPYNARITMPGEVTISFKNVRNAVAFLKNKQNSHYLSKIDELFGEHKFLRSNVIESAMHNPNLIVHTVGTIMSASRIEFSKGQFWMYQEAFTDSIWNIIADLDEEKNRVIKAFDGEESSYLEACKWRNEENLTLDALDVFNSFAATSNIGPTNINTRYIYEDVPNGLCLLESLSKKIGIETPITSSLISLASSLSKVDYRSNARTVESLGLGNLTISEFKELL